ncbi:MAG TPA: DCC1-like thiol-disulfide oxidoreductase family protein [Blastocatellia bacterium]|nr:DCC1-like thiol-disulfide oxidoreductase family protein [Blastocatellia bacterium]
MRRLYVLYDPSCGLCSRVRRWVEAQPAFIEMEFMPATSTKAARWFPTLASRGEPEELVVVGDDGSVYRDGAAWIMCLYGLEEFRAWSYRLSRPAVLPLAREAFNLLSHNRRKISHWLGLLSDSDLIETLKRESTPRCSTGAFQ